jgi:hypothetical protein
MSTRTTPRPNLSEHYEADVALWPGGPGALSARTSSIRWVRVNRQGQGHGVAFTTRSWMPLTCWTGSGRSTWRGPNGWGRTPGRKSQMSARAPGRSTRPISARPAVGSARWCIDRVLTTRSNDRSGKARAATSPTRNDGRGWSLFPRAVGVGAGAGDHGRVQVQAGHLEPVLAAQPERQVAGSAPDLQDLCAVEGDRRDVGRDAFDERGEQKPAQGVVDAGMADEDASRYPVASGGRRPRRMTATVAAVAPAKIAKFRGRIIRPPLGSPEFVDEGHQRRQQRLDGAGPMAGFRRHHRRRVRARRSCPVRRRGQLG